MSDTFKTLRDTASVNRRSKIEAMTRQDAWLNGADFGYEQGRADRNAELQAEHRVFLGPIDWKENFFRLERELALLKDTPGGKRLYGAINEIERLRAENELLQAKLAKEFRPAYDTLELVKERDAELGTIDLSAMGLEATAKGVVERLERELAESKTDVNMQRGFATNLNREVERLTAELKRAGDNAISRAEELAALQAENAELSCAIETQRTLLNKERDQLRAERDKCSAAYGEMWEAKMLTEKERDSLRSQCEKLVAALKDIADWIWEVYCMTSSVVSIWAWSLFVAFASVWLLVMMFG
jgi:DNA repair exonuclease SbcCD ATPase subunit